MLDKKAINLYWADRFFVLLIIFVKFFNEVY